MNALTMPERAAIDGAVFLPLNLCRAASLNPRKRFAKEALEELANSIEKHGVMQPVLARPIPGAKPGGLLYEIVAGERRFRGSKLVAERRKESDIAMIPAIVRELTDFEALELATTENLHRDDLHPLEEAEGFEGLLLKPVAGGEFKPKRIQGFTVDELAARIGKSRGYVFASLKLLSLIPAAREAFYSDKISKSVAILLARMPASVQAPATKEVLQGWGGDPYPFKQASELLQRKFMLKLGEAPFKITDESLVPDAGSCKACPKRTGASPDLFNDVHADVCTDPSCFENKKDAHQERLIAQAKEQGREVIMGAAAKKVMPGKYDSSLKGYMRLDRVSYELDANKSLGKLLGKDAPAVALFEDPHTHELHEVVRTDDAMQALKAKGVIKSAKLPSRPDAERKAEAKAKAETLWRTTVAQRAVDAILKQEFDELDVHAWLLPEVAISMWNRMDFETTKRARKLLAWPDEGGGDVEKKLRALNAAELDQALLAMAIAGQLHVNQYSTSGKPGRLLEVAGHLGIDGAAVRAELDAATKAKAKKPAGKKTPTKPVSVASAKLGNGVESKSKETKPAPAASQSKRVKPAAAKAAEKASGHVQTDNASDDAKELSEDKGAAADKVLAKAGITSVAAWPFPTGAQP